MLSNKAVVALFDWDGTVRTGFTVLDWSNHLSKRGLCEPWLPSTIRGYIQQYKSHELSYHDLCSQAAAAYATGLEGRRESEILSAAEEFVRLPEGRLYPFAERLFALLGNRGIANIVISGAPEVVLRAYADLHPISEVHGLVLAANSSGRITGKVIRNPGLEYQKLACVRTIKQLNTRIVLALGDSFADIPLFEMAEAGIVVSSQSAAFPRRLRARLTQCSHSEVETVALGIVDRLVEATLAS